MTSLNKKTTGELRIDISERTSTSKFILYEPKSSNLPGNIDSHGKKIIIETTRARDKDDFLRIIY